MPKKRGEKGGRAAFGGYSPLNYTPIPDELFDEQMADLSGAELKVLLYIMRRTFGFKKHSDDISLNQIAQGITRRDGLVLDRGTGLSQSTVVVALKGLLDYGYVKAIRRSSKERGNEATTYVLNLVGAEPFSENRRRGGPKIGEALHRKSVTQETVEQDTGKQETALISKERHSTDFYSKYTSTQLSTSLRSQSTVETGPAAEAADVPPSLLTNPEQLSSIGQSSTHSRSHDAAADRVEASPSRGDHAAPAGWSSAAQALASAAERLPHHRRDPDGSVGADGPVVPTYRGRPPTAPPYLVATMADISTKLHDDHPRSSLTRAAKLWKASGLPEDKFVHRLHEAKSVTSQQGSVRGKPASADKQLKNRVPYFFAVVEDLLGMKDAAADSS